MAQELRLGDFATVGELRKLLELYVDECPIVPAGIAIYCLDVVNGSAIKLVIDKEV